MVLIKKLNNEKSKQERKKWNKEIGIAFDKELKATTNEPVDVSDYSVQRSYIELILDLPWNQYSKDKFDLAFARKILDSEHFGLTEVKERIIEHLAVLKLRGDMKSPILCLFGPPGVGKLR